MKCKEIADYICKQLLEQGFIIHKYKAFSTCSIYLKLDYGACNSIRISDHTGYEHLSYKYNINQKCGYPGWRKDKKGFWRYNCPANKEEIDKLIQIILSDKLTKKMNYNYDVLMKDFKDHINYDLSFWRECEEVKL